LQSHKSSENVKKLRNILVDTESDLPKGEVRIQFTFISGQTNFKRNLMQKIFWNNWLQECWLK